MRRINVDNLGRVRVDDYRRPVLPHFLFHHPQRRWPLILPAAVIAVNTAARALAHVVASVVAVAHLLSRSTSFLHTRSIDHSLSQSIEQTHSLYHSLRLDRETIATGKSVKQSVLSSCESPVHGLSAFNLVAWTTWGFTLPSSSSSWSSAAARLCSLSCFSYLFAFFLSFAVRLRAYHFTRSLVLSLSTPRPPSVCSSSSLSLSHTHTQLTHSV
ncbi:hypothetical protein Mapa_002619 [Marchantia paleacea]|nr:hypothetical protein Mapa_002619 [Marchantia paleacea]